MAQTALKAELASKLITAVTGIDPQSDAENYELCQAFVLKSFKTLSFPAPDPFAITEQLDGLEEKFRIHNEETLADELQSRRSELKVIQSKNNPDFLSLLLHLSQNPLSSAALILEKLKTVAVAAENAAQIAARQVDDWKTLSRENSYEEDGLWAEVDFVRHSSDSDWSAEDEHIPPEKSKKPKKASKHIQPDVSDDYENFGIDNYIQKVDVKGMYVVGKAQYWNQQIHLSPALVDSDAALAADLNKENLPNIWVISEIQVIREVLAMLQGLPCSLYNTEDGNIVVNEKFAMKHSSQRSLKAILEWFGAQGNKLYTIRAFVSRKSWSMAQAKDAEAMASRRSFVAELEHQLATWRCEMLVPLDEQFVVGTHITSTSTLASLLEIQQTLDTSLKHFGILYEIIEEYNRAESDLNTTTRAAKHLNLLFDCICELQALGDVAAFMFLLDIFIPCLKTYLKPISRWMRTGELRKGDGRGAIFIEADAKKHDVPLGSLWHKSFVVKRDVNGMVMAPRFMQKEGQKIYTVGKSVLFLQWLREDNTSNVSEQDISALVNDLDLEAVREDIAEETHISPFEDVFVSAMSIWIGKIHSNVSGVLRNILYHDCGLLSSLSALSNVFFMQDGFAMHSFYSILFERLDKNRQGWDDRFLLTELVQSAFYDNKLVDTSKLSIRTNYLDMNKNLGGNIDKQRTVKILAKITVDYKLTWPVLNIIRPESIEVYRRVWTFLLMIKRAQHLVEKLRLSKDDYQDLFISGFFTVRWKVICFLDVLLSYIMEQVLYPQSELLKEKLFEAVDVDGMIDACQSFISKVNDLSLLGDQLTPLYHTIISLLDLARHLTDEYHKQMGQNATYEISDRSIRNISTVVKPVYRKRHDSDSEDSDDDNGTAEDDPQEDQDDKDDKQRDYSFEQLNSKFDELLRFLVAGLKTVARSGVYPETIDVLVERLEMGVTAGGMRLEGYEWASE